MGPGQVRQWQQGKGVIVSSGEMPSLISPSTKLYQKGTHTHTYMHAYIQTCIHTHTHTHTYYTHYTYIYAYTHYQPSLLLFPSLPLLSSFPTTDFLYPFFYHINTFLTYSDCEYDYYSYVLVLTHCTVQVVARTSCLECSETLPSQRR